MMTNRDLDRQLGSWFEARATTIPPDDLLDRSIARVAATRQRPGWLVPDGWVARDGSATPGSRAARIGLVLVAMLTVAILATAVGGLFNHIPAVIVLPSPSPTISPTPSPSDASPSPAEQPTPTPNDAFPARAGMFADLQDFLPASDTVGWVSTSTALYRTEDTGKSWTEIRPGAWPTTAATALVDAETVYLASGGSPATIAVTHDGGASWVERSLEVGATSGGPVFSFRTPSTGSATFTDTETTSPLRVYATTDGGVTWTGPKAGQVPHWAGSFDKLYPPTGAFLMQGGENDRFFLSADGGASWTQYTFPIGKYAPKGAPKGVGGIVLEDNGRILVLIGADGGRNPIPEAIYESGDDTASWRLVTAVPETFEVQFLSPADWVLFSRPLSEIRTTSDGGVTWRTTAASTALYDTYAQKFATPRTGWATEECEYVSGATCSHRHAKVLFVTTDGGVTWTQIGS